MAATSHVSQPLKKHLSHDDPYQSNHYGSYDTGFGSMTSHAYQYQTNPHHHSSEPNLSQYDRVPLSDNSNSTTTKSNEKYGTTKKTQLPPNKTMEIQQSNSIKRKQNPPATLDNHQHTFVRSEGQIQPRTVPKQQNKAQPSSLGQTDLNHKPTVESHVEMKATKSSLMRAKAIKKKEAILEQKRKDQFFAGKLKSQLPPTSPSDEEEKQPKKSKPNKHSVSEGEQTDIERSNRQKKSSHSVPKQRKSRADGYKTEDNSSGDEYNPKSKRSRNKSQKRTTFSDSQLPPLRHGRLPPYNDPYLDYMLPPGHPLRARYPHYADYPPYAGPYAGHYARRPLRDEAEDIPPYLASYRDPYDHFFDYEKRKAKPKRSKSKNDGHIDREDNNGNITGYETEREEGTKSQVSRKVKPRNVNHEKPTRKGPPGYWHQGYYESPYYNETAMLEIWRQERNDYLKKKYKPTIHDVLYSQQWMKSDSYLENQRRRALRDTQGYYFPYKKYTLKDYRDIQKTNNANPFSETNETTIDRKERQKKRQEYGAFVERQLADNPGTRQIPPRDMPPRKPWHVNGGDPLDPEAVSKRERALEYAKDQVKYRPVGNNKTRTTKYDSNDQYENNSYDENNYDQTINKDHQLYDDYD